jgi:PAS domain S-box-containing protein
MSNALQIFFSSGSFIPHGHCYLWKPGLVWLHLVSDALIALAYYSIPLILFYFVRKRQDLPFHWIFLLFAAFIVACGTTHLASIWTLWYPSYWLSGTLKLGTAIVSLFTAFKLVPLVPQALALPSPAQLEEANRQLQAQMRERLRIEEELRLSQNQLELRVAERTAELVTANAQLQQEIRDRQQIEVKRQQAEAQIAALNRNLQNRVNELQTLFDVIPIGILITDDPEFKYVRANPAFARILGVAANNNASFTPPGDLPPYKIFANGRELAPEETPLRYAALHGVAVQRAEVDILRHDGTLFNLYGYAAPLLNEQGKPRGSVGAFLDITDRKRAEAEREQLLEREQIAREAAEMANRVKDEFLAILSHELRTPLNPILGWVRLLRRGNLDQQKTTLALETIERNAKLQTQLIEDLLDISRILQGKMTLNTHSVDLVMVIEAAQETMRLALEAKSIYLQFTVWENGQLITWNQDPGRTQQFETMGDPNRLQQVIWNLLSNAVKFTPEGGRVEVRLERVESRIEEQELIPPVTLLGSSASVSLPVSLAYAQIIVSDTGRGINPNFLPYVFDTFRQADGTTTRQFGGLGLGLAIVRQIVELHGGSVQAESPGEGLGATFTVRLPLVTTSASAKPMAERSPRSGSMQGVRILVVDDEADTRELVAFLLQEQGAIVTTASSAQEAIAAFSQMPPDILVSDIGMPEMNGYSLMQQIRTTTLQNGRIPAIALTAYASESDQQQALDAGFQMHIAKPVEPDVLLKVIANLLSS